MSVQIDFAEAKSNGVYLVGAADLNALDAGARAEGLLTRRASLLGCHDKHDLLVRIAAMLDFPSTFGNNWDALADCLRDLSWLPRGDGVALLLDQAEALRASAPADFDTVLTILRDAATEWKSRDVMFFAFFALPHEAFGND